ASGAPHGQILIGGASPQTAATGMPIQGAAGGPFSTLAPAGGTSAPMALTTAYLGDVALAAPPAAAGHAPGALRVHVERFYAHQFAPATVAGGGGAGPLQALTLAMDYRSEALVVWAQDGAVYARLLPAGGAARPIQRLGLAGTRPAITAVLSDDRRGIVAWAAQRGEQTSVYIDRSAVDVRFGAPELLERFRDPDGLRSPAASPTLVRLSSESVMLAWAGAATGHWVVHTAPVDLDGVGQVGTIAAPGTDALLAGLAAGPLDDALVLWTEPLAGSGAPSMTLQTLYAAQGFNLYPPARTVFGVSEQIAPPGSVRDAAVAFDPDDDRAIAAWQGQTGAIEYSIRK
ncbi:MAG TPA: hypothetical protein VED41_05510, partial [Solirubrobacteraceae bacterium]|nr:hypothetical protein [Solirubrobacteraceae bacterium]